MQYQEVTVGRSLVATLEYGEPLSGELEALASEAGIEGAWFVGSGAVEEADLSVYDQDAFARETVSFTEPLEMPVLVGTITTHRGGAETGGNGKTTMREDTAGNGKTTTGGDTAGNVETTTGADSTHDGETNTETSAGAHSESHSEATTEVTARAVLSRPSGQALAGTLEEATIFGAEVLLQTFEEPLHRDRDQATDMSFISL